MDTQLTEQKIQKALNKFFASEKYNIDGLFVFSWESDKLLRTQAGYYYEFEVKISRADFKNDFKHKIDKHIILSSTMPDDKSQPIQATLFDNLYKQKRKRYPEITKEQVIERWGNVESICRDKRMPNYFYYAVPEGMLEPDEIPPYAGLVYVSEDGKTLRTIVDAPRLHDRKLTDAELNLGEKFYYNMKTWQRNYREQVGYSLMYRERLQDELASKHQEKSYKELSDELKTSQNNVEFWKKEYGVSQQLYRGMVEGADYFKIEERLLLQEMKRLNPDWEKRWKEIMDETERMYIERYPNRK